MRASAAFFLAGAVAGTGLYFGNLAYVRADDEAARAAAAARQAPAPPAPPQTVCAASSSSVSGPALCVAGQSLGSAKKPWIVQGRGFAPGTPVTVSLTWQSPPQVEPSQTFEHTARLKPVVASDGTLRLDIGRLFPGSLRLGLFEVHVTGAGGAKATTLFLVIPPG